jgi:serine/threonine-protein kinase
MPLERLGPYRIEKLLGRGGMGAVYAGVNEQTGERAAIKVLAAHLSDNPDFRDRFSSEVETLKKLRHPNIVQLLAWGEEGDHLFYVMELVEGRSLQDEMQAGRRYDWREVAKIGVEVCRALKHAHDSGVIHRDLKPANLLIDRHNQVKLTDFGIAKLYGGTQITAAGGILGTADYMSPEQAEGKPVNARSDLYSLGSVLYALLAGRPPFAAKTLAEVIHNLRFEKPTPIRRLAPDTPEAFESIIQQLLEKQPNKRVASAFAVGNYLRAMEHALSIETQIGDVRAEDLPVDTSSTPLVKKPSSDQTVSGLDATIASGQRSSSPATEVGGATIELQPGEEAEPDYRLSSSDAATYVPREKTQVAPGAATPAAAAEPVPAKAKFYTLEEEEALRRKRERKGEEGTPQWLLLLGMAAAVIVLGGLIVFALLPPSADTLYRQIAAAAESGELSQLQSVDAEIRQFLERFPADPRSKDLDKYRERLDIARLEKQAQFKARTGRGGSLPVERAYSDAVRLMESDPEHALARFAAIVAVFDGVKGDSDDETERNANYVKLARNRMDELKETVRELSAAQQKLIAARLDQADKLQTDDPETAEQIYRGVIELYADKQWASELVERAKKALEK